MIDRSGEHDRHAARNAHVLARHILERSLQFEPHMPDDAGTHHVAHRQAGRYLPRMPIVVQRPPQKQGAAKTARDSRIRRTSSAGNSCEGDAERSAAVFIPERPLLVLRFVRSFITKSRCFVEIGSAEPRIAP
jgi:hypothetical protein